jgi:zinc transporter ZupT
VTLYVLWRAPGAIGETFRRWPAWRDAILVALLGGVVAYLANDSGPAAAGLAFGLALGGMLGVALLAMPRPAAGEMMEP